MQPFLQSLGKEKGGWVRPQGEYLSITQDINHKVEAMLRQVEHSYRDGMRDMSGEPGVGLGPHWGFFYEVRDPKDKDKFIIVFTGRHQEPERSTRHNDQNHVVYVAGFNGTGQYDRLEAFFFTDYGSIRHVFAHNGRVTTMNLSEENTTLLERMEKLLKDVERKVEKGEPPRDAVKVNRA